MTPRQIRAGAVSQSVGRNVRHWRRWKGISEAALADALASIGHPVRRNAISAIETGQQGVSVDRLVAFAEVLQISPQQLLEGPACRSCWDTPPPLLTCQVCGVAG